jgi:hypothetical protein
MEREPHHFGGIWFLRVYIRVVDPDWFYTDPDPAFLLNPDPVQNLSQIKSKTAVLFIKKIFKK